jgi:hypothetical protein
MKRYEYEILISSGKLSGSVEHMTVAGALKDIVEREHEILCRTEVYGFKLIMK